jgi:UDP-N-acetylglucosamine 2-epimerase (non-hydrolysing)
MPEEINRVVADHISDHLSIPTETARMNLKREGIPDDKIFTVGNTIVDAVFQNFEIAKKRVNMLKKFNLTTGQYFLVTAHRAENVDDPAQLGKIIAGLREIGRKYTMPVLFPVHPRTEKNIRHFGIAVDGLTLTPPKNFLEFLQLESHAKLILTDSGSVQEEACILGVPCVTLRDNTERPETVEVGANSLAGVEPGDIVSMTEKMINVSRKWKNPYGNGSVAEQIILILEKMN